MKEEPDNSSSDFSILGCIFTQMAQILGLGYQTHYLNYRSENWQHADLDYETYQSLMKARGENEFFPADDDNDTTLESLKAMLQSSIPEDLDPWKAKLLWASDVLPMPLVGLLIIGGVCIDVGRLTSGYPNIEALSRLDFSAAMKVFIAKLLTSE
ncbi:hypothetical protein TSUD_141180 [Trifolium subterraneum]|uniref:Uncharacterized protein n=1 Tax=Trifolium subterraneum TaxID=3900 RepID=A0A2Z6PU80_TRISU|nr:hypothetical protein TSUD_141180 [Trifolium subterraneum]